MISSQITHTESSAYTLTHILDICALIFSLSQPHHVTASAPPQVINTRAQEGGPKEHRAKQKWPRETKSVTYEPGLSTLSDLSRIEARPPQSFLCCPRPPSHYPSSLTSVSSYPPSTYFNHQHHSGHTVLIHSFHMPKPSLICSTS